MQQDTKPSTPSHFPTPPTGAAERFAKTAQSHKEQLNTGQKENIRKAFDPSSKVCLSLASKIHSIYLKIYLPFTKPHQEAWERLSHRANPQPTTKKRTKEPEPATVSKKPKSASPVLRTLDFSFILVNCTARVHANKYSLPSIHEYIPLFQSAKSLMKLPGAADSRGLS